MKLGVRHPILRSPALEEGASPQAIQAGTWHEADEAKRLADLLIIPDEKARALLGTILLYVCHKYADQA